MADNAKEIVERRKSKGVEQFVKDNNTGFHI